MPKQEVSFDKYEAENPGAEPQPPKEGMEAPEIPPQETPPEIPEETIPEVDERGVPAPNVLAEVRRKQNELNEELRKIREQNAVLQAAINNRLPAVAQQTVNKVSEPEAIQQIEKEIDQAISEGKITTQGQVLAYYERRKQELMPPRDIEQVIRTMSTRGASEQRAIGEFADLNNLQSPLSQAVLREVQTREIRDPKFRENNPYYLEEISHRIASTMGIKPASWNKGNGMRERIGMPAVDAGSRQNVKHEQTYTPSEADIKLSPYFKSDPKEIAKSRKQQQANPKTFVFPEV